MPVVDKYEMLFGEVNQQPADYKVSLDDNDESLNRADFLWPKLSPRNKIGESTELDTNKNLIPCQLKNEKIVLSPNDSGSTGGENVIVIDTYHIIESTDQLPLTGERSSIKLVCFPFQFATGQIKTIIVQQAQPLGPKLKHISMAIYANDKPGLEGSRLIWGSAGTETFNDSGLLSFYNSSTGKCTGPVIPGYTTVGGVQKPNTFFYVVFGGQADSDGGYKLLGLKNPTGYNLLASIGGVNNIGEFTKSDKTEAFHLTFDYTVDTDNIENMIIPHIAFEMIV